MTAHEIPGTLIAALRDREHDRAAAADAALTRAEDALRRWLRHRAEIASTTGEPLDVGDIRAMTARKLGTLLEDLGFGQPRPPGKILARMQRAGRASVDNALGARNDDRVVSR